MKKITLLILLFGFIQLGWGQEDSAQDELKKKLTAELSEITKQLEGKYEKYKKLYDEEYQNLEDLKKNIDINTGDTFLSKLPDQIEITKKYNDSVVDLLGVYQGYKIVYIHKGLTAQEIDVLFKYSGVQATKSSKENVNTETKVYSYFGDDEVINHDIFKNKTREAEILKKVLLDKGKESYLGDITIPRKDQRIKLYDFEKNKIEKKKLKKQEKLLCKQLNIATNLRDSLNKYKKDTAEIDSQITKYLNDIYNVKQNLSKIKRRICDLNFNFNEDSIYVYKTFKFQKLDIEIRDGYFHDIRVFLEDDEYNTHVFTNSVGLSLLFYSQYGKRKKFLIYKYSIRKNTPETDEYTDSNLKKIRVKVTDVMGYSYKVGNHYIPHDLALELPAKDKDGNLTNLESNTTYQIQQETHLEKIVELRAYSDFLALFGGSSNGLAQFEGKAKFYLFPYPFRFLWSDKTMGQIEYLPSFSAYANFSRFEEKSKYVDLLGPGVGNRYSIKSELDLIEKRFLTVGGDVELFKWQHKNAPIKLSLYGTINYNISQVNFGTDQEPDVMNLKALNRGFGAHFSGRRFNNFGFDCKAEFTWYDYENFNDFKSNNSRKLILSSEIPVFKNEAELFYHTNGNPNQAIFVRLITYKYASSEPNQSFYQFQFGYKFAIGARKVNVPD